MRSFTFLLLLSFCFACGGTSNTASKSSDTVTKTAPVQTTFTGDTTAVCALLTEADIRALSSFKSAPHIQSILNHSPDGSTTVCQWMAMNKGISLVLNEHDDPNSMERLEDNIKRKGYKLVEGLGQKAAFDERKGYLKWVRGNGMLMTAYIFSKGATNPSANYQELYDLAKKLEYIPQGS